MSKIPRDVIDHFASIPLFSGSSKKGLQALAMGTDEVMFHGGSTLFREGDPASQLFVLISGIADVYRGGQQVAELRAGDLFGELAMLTGASRSTTVQARTELRCLLLTGSQLQGVLDNEPWMAKAVIRNLARRLEETVRSVGG